MLDMAEGCLGFIFLRTLNGPTSIPLEFQGLPAQSFCCIDANTEGQRGVMINPMSHSQVQGQMAGRAWSKERGVSGIPPFPLPTSLSLSPFLEALEQMGSSE